MAHFHPPVPPHFLSERMRDAERMVWDVLQQLDYSWHVFYSARENSGSGWDREIDFVLIRLNRIFYCEVKGGVVVVDQRAGPGVTWKHFTRSGEEISKRADPKQLWMAKAALGETIRQIAGQSPRDLGFREHDLYIFPHTPKQVTQGADLERGNIHYAFGEDIAALPGRLQQIVGSGKGRFIDRSRIESIIRSLDAMVLKESDGTLPRLPGAAYLPRYENLRPASEPVIRSTTQSRRSLHSFRFPPFWKGAAVLLGLFAILVAFVEFATAPAGQRHELPRWQSEPTASAPRPLTPKRKTPTEDRSTALPSFIAPVSADDVERAITAAQDPAVYVSWQSGAHHGFVILRSDDGNGCRLYQISRHDLPTTEYDTIRRCSELRQ